LDFKAQKHLSTSGYRSNPKKGALAQEDLTSKGGKAPQENNGVKIRVR
jgi:hypothetical protein